MYTNLQHHQIKNNYICKMKLTIFLLSVVIVCFAAMCYLFHIKPVEPKIIESDSAKVSKALFDSVVTEIGLLKKNDSIRTEILDSLIRIKYNDKTKYIYLTSAEHSALRLRLLATLDSTEFTY